MFIEMMNEEFSEEEGGEGSEQTEPQSYETSADELSALGVQVNRS